jgi:hypothetical protein
LERRLPRVADARGRCGAAVIPLAQPLGRLRQGWFLGVHTFTRFVKVAFFRGTSLRPVPPGSSKSKEARYLDLNEADEVDETQLAAWVKQAAALPGWVSG